MISDFPWKIVGFLFLIQMIAWADDTGIDSASSKSIKALRNVKSFSIEGIYIGMPLKAFKMKLPNSGQGEVYGDDADLGIQWWQNIQDVHTVKEINGYFLDGKIYRFVAEIDGELLKDLKGFTPMKNRMFNLFGEPDADNPDSDDMYEHQYIWKFPELGLVFELMYSTQRLERVLISVTDEARYKAAQKDKLGRGKIPF